MDCCVVRFWGFCLCFFVCLFFLFFFFSPSRGFLWALLLLLLLSSVSCVRLCVTPQTAAHQAALSLGFPRQENWSGLPFPSPPLALSTLILLKSNVLNSHYIVSYRQKRLYKVARCVGPQEQNSCERPYKQTL